MYVISWNASRKRLPDNRFMTKEETALLHLVREGLCEDRATAKEGLPVFGRNAEVLLRLAHEQGVTGIAWTGYQRLHDRLPEDRRWPAAVKLKWFTAAESVRRSTRGLFQLAAEFSELLYRKGQIRCVVLKGIDYAHFYPHPEYREYGDLDCWLCGAAERGDEVARDAGAECDAGNYKHSHIHYRGLTIENHRCFTSHDFTKSGLRIEERLKELMESGAFRPISGTRLLSPPPAFTAVFLLRHACGHFAAEGIRLRYVTDWVQFLRRHGDVFGSCDMQHTLRETRLLPFAEMLTAFSVRYLGLSGSFSVGNVSESRLRSFAHDLFAVQPSITDRRPHKVAARILRRFCRMWKYRNLLDESYLTKVKSTMMYSDFLHRRKH